jgi:hypothetical protein
VKLGPSISDIAAAPAAWKKGEFSTMGLARETGCMLASPTTRR